MWKIAHPRPRMIAKNEPTSPTAAMSHRSKKMISPAYMLPKSRSECDSGFEMYSTQLKRKLAGHRSGLEPNGAQKSSCMKPRAPFAEMAKPIIRNHTESDSAKVVFTSAVGT